MKQREKENTIKVFPGIYSSPYYELEAWIELGTVEDEEDKKCILEDFANEGFLNANHTRCSLGVFLTKERALMQMDELLDYEEEDEDWCSYFFIREKPLYMMMNPSDYIKEWLYHRGRLVDESLVRNYDYDDKFRGRPKEMIRFNVGDIAIELGGDGSSYWGVVASVPPIYDGRNHGDYSDDQYAFYTSACNHTHVLAHRLIRPWHIPDYIEELLRKETARISSQKK